MNLVVDKIRIGTRGSPLALAQAREVQRRLSAALGLPTPQLAIEVIKTSGDRIQDRPLSEVGGKGLFTKEIEEALRDGRIDIAVHSAKDMATRLPDGLAIGAILERQDVREAFISLVAPSPSALPAGARIGSSSLRRRAQVKRARPDLQVVDFRGNVETRLAKLQAGVAEATFLAAAGLRRLGQEHRITQLVPVEMMLPAPAQGAIALELRADDADITQAIALLDHWPTHLCVATERAFLAGLDGSCRTPIAALATLTGDRLEFHGSIYTPDGSISHETRRSGRPAQACEMGADAARELLGLAGPSFFGKSA